MSFSLSDATTRLNSLQFNDQEKGQLKAQLMKLNSEQLYFLFNDDDETVTASLAYLLKDLNNGSNSTEPTHVNNVNNPNINNPSSNNGPKNSPSNIDSPPYIHNNYSNNNSNGPPKCLNFNACQKYCYPNPNGGYYDYCGNSCRLGNTYRQNNSNNSNINNPHPNFKNSSTMGSFLSSFLTPVGWVKSLMGIDKDVQQSNKVLEPEIHFYHKGEPYYEFTNFFEAEIEIDGKKWKTTEHYFQAQKFPSHPELMEEIRNQSTPREAFSFARQNNQLKRLDWEDTKEEVMLQALRAKFRQHKELHDLLLGTNNRKLVEHTVNDSYWGDGGGNNQGRNRLGALLIQVRDELRKNPNL